MLGSVARRYAKAIFALAREQSVHESVAQELARVVATASDPTVASTLRNPVLSSARLHALVDTFVKEFALSDLVTRFLKLLAERRRLQELPNIFAEFQRLLDRELGQTRARIRSASPLSEPQQTQIIDKFSHLTGKRIIPQVEVDAALLGGVVVEIEGRVYDGSVYTQLTRAAKGLSGTAVL